MIVGGVEVTTAAGIVTWTCGMAADADGSPRAYASYGSKIDTLDELRNAGNGVRWPGLVCNDDGVPYVQGPGDPFPGAYLSGTALINPHYAERDPRRYLDSEVIAYVSVPPELLASGMRKGDLCVVRYNGLLVGAIVGDVGPHKKIGEGSVMLHRQLGVDPFRAKPRHKLVGIDSGVTFRVLLNTASSPPWPRPNYAAEALALGNPTA